MILIPELETVVILVPRTGSSSLRRAILARYPRALQVYRHMEADGVPAGYDRWRRLGVVRHPVARLWSLYNFLKDFAPFHSDQGREYRDAQRASVAQPFEHWIVDNNLVFTSPYDSAGLGRFFPAYTVRHPLPETRKSQFVYLRPDLGTEIYGYDQLDDLASSLDVELAFRFNASTAGPPPALSNEPSDHVNRYFHWDFEAATASCDVPAHGQERRP